MSDSSANSIAQRRAASLLAEPSTPTAIVRGGVARPALLGVGYSPQSLVANVLQSAAWNLPLLVSQPPGEQPVVVCALPLHHIFAFTVVMLLGLQMGACSLMIPDARDVEATLRELARHRFQIFPADDTLFSALARKLSVLALSAWPPDSTLASQSRPSL